MSRVTLTNISKTYPNGFKAVDGFSLDIADGEFVVFVGPSGCGKSTTLRLIAGLEEDFSGDIRIGERLVNTLEPKDRDIAMVFQNYALYPHMTAYKNMSLALELRGVPKDQVRTKVNDAARMLGIENLLERKPGQLSGGQRQRVALGRAIVRQPKAFLFDEPLSNLDAKLRVSTRAELKSLHQRLKTTSIYVTHDQEEAMTLGDRIVVMAGGRIQQAAPPLEVYRRPVNRFVAGFVGMPPMNFLTGTLGPSVFVERGASGITLPLARDAAERLRGRAGEGQDLVAGFRPQSLARSSNGTPFAVQSVEPLGEQMDLQLSTPAGATVVARLPADDGVRAGQTLALTIAPETMHVFEPGEFGRNLTLA
ncbi:MAG: ABC transporter ATP-binding protein [Phycisphaerales bacterium]